VRAAKSTSRPVASPTTATTIVHTILTSYILYTIWHPTYSTTHPIYTRTSIRVVKSTSRPVYSTVTYSDTLHTFHHLSPYILYTLWHPSYATISDTLHSIYNLSPYILYNTPYPIHTCPSVRVAKSTSRPVASPTTAATIVHSRCSSPFQCVAIGSIYVYIYICVYMCVLVYIYVYTCVY